MSTNVTMDPIGTRKKMWTFDMLYGNILIHGYSEMKVLFLIRSKKTHLCLSHIM